MQVVNEPSREGTSQFCSIIRSLKEGVELGYIHSGIHSCLNNVQGEEENGQKEHKRRI